MLTNFTHKITLLTAFLGLHCLSAVSQTSIRPYTLVYSENLKGGCTMFGNTSMQIMNNAVVDLAKMNQAGNTSNGVGGLGYSQYGNDGNNMQFTDIDATPANLNLLSLGSANWKYLANGSDQGTAWRTLSNPVSPWVTATASIGYGYTQTTSIAGGNITAYFLKNVTVTDAALYRSFDFTYSYDDGAVIYVNGIEVARANMPAGTISYNTLAPANNYTTGATISIPASYFKSGNNVIAVEIHQNAASSIDCYFDMSITAIGLSTISSSSADLLLPSGTNKIKFARLYWGGRISNSAITATPDTLRKIKIRKGTAGYSNALAPATNVDSYSVNSSETVYQAYVDITSYIQSNGAGTYTIADLPATPGSVSGGGKYAGWAIVVAYENTSLNYNSVRIYDGYSQVFNNGSPVTQTVVLNGLNVPSNPLIAADAVMETMAWEGDANLGASSSNPAGDYLKINSIPVSNTVNPVTNFWNGSISRNGVYVTGTKNPDYYNQMGIDIDEINVGTGYGIQPNATSVSIEFGTEADQYFPSVFSFAIRMKDPVVTLKKMVTDASNNYAVESNEILTYTLSGNNSGTGIAYNVIVIDTLPVNVTYIPGTLELVSAPGCTAGIQTEGIDGDKAMVGTNAGRNYVKFFIGNGSTGTTGGSLPIGSSYILKLKVRAAAILGSISNTARITANSQAGDLFIDESTAVISPSGGPLDVKLSSFTAALVNKSGYLTWITESELNAAYFEIERSEDGIKFEKRGTIQAAGNSSSKTTYHYTDLLNSSSKIFYYRLRIVDLDGKNNYSKIVAIKINGASGLDAFSVYPNPFITDIKVNMTSQDDVMATFRIISFDGRELLNRKMAVAKGDNIIVLNEFGTLTSGNYILEVTTPNDQFIKKIIKN